jgi:HK97 family phage major capsid protein
VGILGAWNYYWIVDSLAMEIQALFELYARTNQNGYICRCECDGAPVQPAAFRRVQLA